MAACRYQSRGYEESGASLLTEVHGRGLGDNGHKMKQGRFVLYQEVLVCDEASKKGTWAL